MSRIRSIPTIPISLYVVLLLSSVFHFLSLSTAAYGYLPNNRLGPRSFSQLSAAQVTSLIETLDPIAGVEKHLERIMIPRVSSTPSNVVVRDYIISHLRSLNWHIAEDPFEDDTPLGRKSFVNIIATKDLKASRRVVLSAHYDSKYFAPPDDQFVGATDSAFPCALMLDLAEALNPMLEARIQHLEDDDLPPTEDEDVADTTLQLVFFDGEEAFVTWTDTDSIYGARHLADNWGSSYFSPDSLSAVTAVVPPSSRSEEEESETEGLSPRRLLPATSLTLLSTIEHLILLDLLGAKQPLIKSYFKDTAWLFSQLKDTEKRLGDMDAFVFGPDKSMDAQSYVSYFRPVPVASAANVGYMGDDHLPFLRRGVPVLHLIADPFPHVWHKLTDDATALDKTTMRRWNILMRVFMGEYLGLTPMDNKREVEFREDGSKNDTERDELTQLENDHWETQFLGY